MKSFHVIHFMIIMCWHCALLSNCSSATIAPASGFTKQYKTSAFTQWSRPLIIKFDVTRRLLLNVTEVLLSICVWTKDLNPKFYLQVAWHKWEFDIGHFGSYFNIISEKHNTAIFFMIRIIHNFNDCKILILLTSVE